MRTIKLTHQEKNIENALINKEYTSIPKEEFSEIAKTISVRKKDAVLNVRVNSNDLKNIKDKAHRLGIKYQTFISEILHKVAQA